MEIPSLTGKKILLCDDDFYCREMMVYLLNKTCATLFIAEDGKETINYFRDNDIDLVLLDLQLPHMDGFEVLKEIKSIDPGIIVIAQTALTMHENIMKFRQAGFDDYLAKPIVHTDLYNMLDKHLCRSANGTMA